MSWKFWRHACFKKNLFFLSCKEWTRSSQKKKVHFPTFWSHSGFQFFKTLTKKKGIMSWPLHHIFTKQILFVWKSAKVDISAVTLFSSKQCPWLNIKNEHKATSFPFYQFIWKVNTKMLLHLLSKSNEKLILQEIDLTKSWKQHTIFQDAPPRTYLPLWNFRTNQPVRKSKFCSKKFDEL